MPNGYSSESTRRELSNEYLHDRVSMLFKDFSRGLALVKKSKRPPDFRFSNHHRPTEDLIALDFLMLQSLPKTIFEGLSYLFTVLWHIGNLELY